MTRLDVLRGITARDAADRAAGCLYAAVTIADDDMRISADVVGYGRTEEEATANNPDWDFVYIILPEDAEYAVARKAVAETKGV